MSAVQFGCNFAVTSLCLQDTRQRNELAGYSRISSVKRLLNFRPGGAQQIAHGTYGAPLFADHSAQIVGADCEFKHSLATLFDRTDGDLCGIVDQSFGDLLDQYPHVSSWHAFL